MPAYSLKELGAAAITELEDLELDHDEWEDFRNAPELDRLVARYGSVQTDNFAFALHQATSWPMVAIAAAKGPLIRMNVDEQGRLVGAYGYKTQQQLGTLFGVPEVTCTPVSTVAHNLDSDEAVRRVLGAMEWMIEPPFVALRPVLAKLAKAGEFFGDADPVQSSTERDDAERP